MLRLKAFSIVLHIAGWLLFLMLPLLFMENGQQGTLPGMLYSLPFLSFCVCYISLFYLNTYYLIPEYFIRKKYVTYFACVVLLFIGVFYLRPFDKLMNSRDQKSRSAETQGRSLSDPGRQDFNMPPAREPGAGQGPDDGYFNPGPGHRPGNGHPAPDHRFNPGPPMGGRPGRHMDINSLLIFVLVMAFGMAMKSVAQWQITEKRAILAEADKAIAELSFLKAQINPHFLYNTLNNIYTLSVIGSEKTSDSIMKLSNIMRYVTDEAEADFVPLSNELNCISNFIDLQKLRLGKMVTLNYSVAGDPADYQICPLLLMTFIENVFKYGLSNHLPALITISIRMENGSIVFHSQNTIFDHKRHRERTGIGISNTKKRLEHLYPDKYTLVIDQADQLFTVDLVLRS
jgi:two-component system LytT family sensor kinase